MAGSLIGFTKTFFLPAFIAFAFYIFLTYAALPLYRQHRQRYAQYLPLNEITQTTSSIWGRIYDGVLNRLPPSWTRFSFTPSHYDHSTTNEDEGDLFDDEEGESLVGFNIDDSRRAAAMRDNGGLDTERRLSRDLEEGFRDDSDEEADTAHTRRVP